MRTRQDADQCVENYFNIVSSITANNSLSQYVATHIMSQMQCPRTMEPEYPLPHSISNPMEPQAKKANAATPTAETRSLPPSARVAAPPWKAMGEVLAVLVPVAATAVPVADAEVLLDGWT